MWKDRVIVTLLQSEEVTQLLAEVHKQLLKALLKEEDDQQTVFGPMDLRVSINLIIMFGNTLMWPQLMRIYLLLCTCCETCPAVYPLQCVDPPLEHVPQEDWQCPVCTAEFSKGETDCKFYVKQSGVLCRQVFLRNLFGIVKLFELFLSPCRIA